MYYHSEIGKQAQWNEVRWNIMEVVLVLFCVVFICVCMCVWRTQCAIGTAIKSTINRMNHLLQHLRTQTSFYFLHLQLQHHISAWQVSWSWVLNPVFRDFFLDLLFISLKVQDRLCSNSWVFYFLVLLFLVLFLVLLSFPVCPSLVSLFVYLWSPQWCPASFLVCLHSVYMAVCVLYLVKFTCLSLGVT